MSARSAARGVLAARMRQCVGQAPMTFLADPQVPLLTAELLIRDLEELGWTPPREPAPPRPPKDFTGPGYDAHPGHDHEDCCK